MGSNCCIQELKQDEAKFDAVGEHASKYPSGEAGLEGDEAWEGNEGWEGDWAGYGEDGQWEGQWEGQESYEGDCWQELQKEPATSSEESPAASHQKGFSAEDASEEKARLQTLVGSFAKRAVQGCSCMLMQESDVCGHTACEPVPAKYKLDAKLEVLTISSASGANLLSLPIASIQDIYSHAGDGPQAFPPKALATVTSEQKELLLMVVCKDGAACKTVLMESSSKSLETFLECMRVLVVYARARSQGA